MNMKYIKSVFNLKSILTCFIGAIGYGVGYNLPNELNWNPIACIICCLALGTVFDLIGKKILNNKFFNSSTKNKVIVAAIVYIGYLIAWIIVKEVLNHDLDYDFLYYLGFLIVIQIVLLIVNAIKHYFKDKKEGK